MPRRGMVKCPSASLNKRITPMPACAERRSINAQVTAKPTFATVKPPQRRLQRCTATTTPVFTMFQILCAVTSVVEIRPLSPYRSRNATTKFGRCARAFKDIKSPRFRICCISKHVMLINV